jgi:hypothetical protein
LTENEVRKGEYGTILIKDHTWTWVNATIYQLDDENGFMLQTLSTPRTIGNLPSSPPPSSSSSANLNSILLTVAGSGLMGVTIGALVTYFVLGRRTSSPHAAEYVKVTSKEIEIMEHEFK